MTTKKERKPRGKSTGRRPSVREICATVAFHYPVRLHAQAKQLMAELAAANLLSDLPDAEQARLAADWAADRATKKAAKAAKKGGQNVL